MPAYRAARIAFLLTVLTFPLAAQSTPETEPNDAAGSATLARLGDTISGLMNPDDVDYFAVDLEPGTQLELAAAYVPFCRDFSLLDPSGNRLAFGNCMEGIDTLRFVIAVGGRYLIRVTQFDDAPGERPTRPYSLHIGTTNAALGIEQVVAALLAAAPGTLDPAFVQQLDRQGNGNGILDVG